MTAIPIIIVVSIANIAIQRVKNIHKTRKLLSIRRRDHATLKEQRVTHARQLEDLAGGVSLAAPTGDGRLSQIDGRGGEFSGVE